MNIERTTTTIQTHALLGKNAIVTLRYVPKSTELQIGDYIGRLALTLI